MRALALVLAVAGLLALPVAADASICRCAKNFAYDYNRSPAAHLNFQKVADEHAVGPRTQAQIEQGIYDWERGGYPRQEAFWRRFCRREELTASMCRKLRNCLIAGGATYGAALATGASRQDATILAASDCVVAIVTTP